MVAVFNEDALTNAMTGSTGERLTIARANNNCQRLESIEVGRATLSAAQCAPWRSRRSIHAALASAAAAASFGKQIRPWIFILL